MEVAFCAGDRAIECSDLSRFVQICQDPAPFGHILARSDPDLSRNVRTALWLRTLGASGGIESRGRALTQRLEDLVEANDAEQAPALNDGQDEGALVLQAL